MHWTQSGELMIIIIVAGLPRWLLLLGAIVFLLLEEKPAVVAWCGGAGLCRKLDGYFGPLLIMVVLFGRGGLSGIIARVLAARDAASKDACR